MDKIIILYRVPEGMDIVIPVPTLFNMRVFKIPVSITRGGKIFPQYPPHSEYYLRVSEGAGFFNILTEDWRSTGGHIDRTLYPSKGHRLTADVGYRGLACG